MSGLAVQVIVFEGRTPSCRSSKQEKMKSRSLLCSGLCLAGSSPLQSR